MASIDLVVVPKSIAAEWWHRSWAEVMSAAEGKHEGMRVYVPPWNRTEHSTPGKVFRPRDKQGQFVAGWEDWDDIAFLRRADSGNLKGRPILFQQNW